MAEDEVKVAKMPEYVWIDNPMGDYERRCVSEIEMPLEDGWTPYARVHPDSEVAMEAAKEIAFYIGNVTSTDRLVESRAAIISRHLSRPDLPQVARKIAEKWFTETKANIEEARERTGGDFANIALAALEEGTQKLASLITTTLTESLGRSGEEKQEKDNEG